MKISTIAFLLIALSSCCFASGINRTTNDVQKIISSHKNIFTAIYEKHIPLNPKIGSQLKIKWKILKNGDVRNVEIVNSNISDSMCEKEIISHFETLNFDTTNIDSTSASYMFVFVKRFKQNIAKKQDSLDSKIGDTNNCSDSMGWISEKHFSLISFININNHKICIYSNFNAEKRKFLEYDLNANEFWEFTLNVDCKNSRIKEIVESNYYDSSFNEIAFAKTHGTYSGISSFSKESDIESMINLQCK